MCCVEYRFCGLQLVQCCCEAWHFLLTSSIQEYFANSDVRSKIAEYERCWCLVGGLFICYMRVFILKHQQNKNLMKKPPTPYAIQKKRAWEETHEDSSREQGAVLTQRQRKTWCSQVSSQSVLKNADLVSWRLVIAVDPSSSLPLSLPHVGSCCIAQANLRLTLWTSISQIPGIHGCPTIPDQCLWSLL